MNWLCWLRLQIVLVGLWNLPAWGQGVQLNVQMRPDGMVSISWAGEGVLEWSSELGGMWSVLEGAKSGWTVQAEGSQRFFRVRQVSDAPILVNGGFEEGPSVGWVQLPGNMIYTAEELGLSPHSGGYAAWIGFHSDNRRFGIIRQQITLPLKSPIFLTFWAWVYSEELCDPPWWDSFGVYANGEALLENARLCQGNTGGDGWRRIQVDVSALAGQTFDLAFAINSVDTLASVALIDEIAFEFP